MYNLACDTKLVSYMKTSCWRQHTQKLQANISQWWSWGTHNRQIKQKIFQHILTCNSPIIIIIKEPPSVGCVSDEFNGYMDVFLLTTCTGRNMMFSADAADTCWLKADTAASRSSRKKRFSEHRQSILTAGPTLILFLVKRCLTRIQFAYFSVFVCCNQGS